MAGCAMTWQAPATAGWRVLAPTKTGMDTSYARMIREAKQSDFLLAIDSMGRVVDFHALRHTTATWLIHEGNDAKTVPSVMHHPAIMLTLDLHGHLFPGAKAQTVASICHRFTTDTEAESVPIGKEAVHHWHTMFRRVCTRSDANPCKTPRNANTCETLRNGG